MGNILQFPKTKSLNVRSLQKSEVKRLLLSLSILSVITVTVSLSEKIISQNRPTYYFAGTNDLKYNSQRQIASVGPSANATSVEEIKWGQSVIQKLNSSKYLHKAHIAKESSLLDQISFGELAGKYRIGDSDNKRVNFIQYQESDDVTDQPVYIQNRLNFLTQYTSLIGFKFAKTHVIASKSSSEIYQLLDQSGKDIGQAAFEFDQDGRLINLKVQSK